MPAPPYSVGKIVPNRPSLPSSLMVARGNSPGSSHFMTLGAISRSAKSRTIFFSCSCSSESWKSKLFLRVLVTHSRSQWPLRTKPKQAIITYRMYGEKSQPLSIRSDEGEQFGGFWHRAGFFMRKHSSPVDQNFQFAHGVLHLGLNSVFRLQFALQAPGLASQIASNQAAADFHSHRVVYHRSPPFISPVLLPVKAPDPTMGPQLVQHFWR